MFTCFQSRGQIPPKARPDYIQLPANCEFIPGTVPLDPKSKRAEALLQQASKALAARMYKREDLLDAIKIADFYIQMAEEKLDGS